MYLTRTPGCRSAAAAALLLLFSGAALAGPPFQTDDPEPIDYGHYEFYTFGTSDGTHIETDTTEPAAEFNWGALPNVHLHVIVPAAAIFPSDGPREFGLGDIELGIKYRFVQEGKHRPMVGTFVMLRCRPATPIKAWAWARPGTSCRSGCRKVLVHGRLTEAAA